MGEYCSLLDRGGEMARSWERGAVVGELRGDENDEYDCYGLDSMSGIKFCRDMSVQRSLGSMAEQLHKTVAT